MDRIGPDAITITCPSCGEAIEGPRSAIGKRAQCHGCKTVFVVQEPAIGAVKDARGSVTKPQLSNGRRQRRRWVIAAALLAAAILMGLTIYGLSSRLIVTECYILDIAVIDEHGQQFKAVLLAVHTKPEADRLDAAQCRLVGPGAKTYGHAHPQSPVFPVGKQAWFAFVVPEDVAHSRELEFRIGKKTILLPQAIETKRYDELRKERS